MKDLSKLKRAIEKYEKVALYLSLVLMLIILGSVGIQVITRTFFDMPMKFTEEVSIFCLIGMIYSGVGVVEKNEDYLRVEVFQSLMPKKLRNILQFAAKALVLVLIYGILRGEFAIFPSIAMLKTTAANIPYSWLHIWIIVFSFLWAILVVLDTFIMVERMRLTGLAEKPAQEEEVA